eukprot:9392861-Heterocapsa_arctica.AAC.1
MEPNPNLERGNHIGKDRAYRIIPGHEAKSEEVFGQARSGQADERGGKQYHHDEKEGHKLFRGSAGAE